jgi:Hsp70 protein
LPAKYIVGIDLGTTNSALARCEAATEEEQSRIEIDRIPQLVNPNEVADRNLLPSFLYVPGEFDFPSGSLVLPWDMKPKYVIGELARKRGAETPNRLVASAKSWLSYAAVNRMAPILPWQAPEEVPKLSPVEASSQFLQYLRKVWDSRNADDLALSEQDVLLTVPASFDEEARELTRRAAKQAGYKHVTLLEEPQAAFYAWLESQGDAWRSRIKVGDLVLVCDVGGGTTDFSLISVSEENGELILKRVAVGEHILLGGDNMDLALAYTLQARLEAEGKSLDAWQFLALTHAASRAKITLFEDTDLAEAPIAVPSRGSSLFAKTVATALDRDTLSQVVLDGFFAQTTLDDLPRETRRTGLQEFGLPYASDPVISKHLARFLTRSLQNVQASDKFAGLAGSHATGHALMPTAVLFNGGVFKAAPIRARILDLLAAWNGGRSVRELEGFEPDLAVAQGAAIYGQHRATGKGIRITAGTSRSYYVGLEASMPAIPGFHPPVKALCVVPQGMQEGTDLLIEGRTFGLVTGQAADFRFFSSSVRSGDTPGQVLPDAERELEETSLLEVELPALDDAPAGAVVPVQIEAAVTELGTLELWMKHTNSDRRWKIEFQVRTE